MPPWMSIGSASYRSIASILKTGLDKAFLPDTAPDADPIQHGNIVAAATTTDLEEEDPMLINHTHERLVALGLSGMAKAFDDQRRQPDVTALTFEQRLGLMIDREATERENKRLVVRLKFASLRQTAIVEDVICAPRAHRPRFLCQACRWRMDRPQTEFAYHRALRRQKLDRLRVRHKACRDNRSVLYHRTATAVRSAAPPAATTLCSAPEDAVESRSAHPRRLGPRPAHRRAASRSSRSR